MKGNQKQDEKKIKAVISDKVNLSLPAPEVTFLNAYAVLLQIFARLFFLLCADFYAGDSYAEQKYFSA